jgi:hypothetical protein
MVDAALVGLDHGESVTIPSLPDVADWEAFEDARRSWLPKLSLSFPAPSSGIPALGWQSNPPRLRRVATELSTPATESLKEKLHEVRCQIDSWRKTRISLQHVPERIWEAAVELARIGGVNPVASVLGLNYYRLKRKVEASQSAVTESKALLSPGAMSSVCSTIFSPEPNGDVAS